MIFLNKERRDNPLAVFTGIAKHPPMQQGSSRLYVYIEHERQLILLHQFLKIGDFVKTYKYKLTLYIMLLCLSFFVIYSFAIRFVIFANVTIFF